jgi:hypothetical protein
MGFGSRLKATSRWVRPPFSYLSSLTICAISPALAQTDVMAPIATAAQTNQVVVGAGNLTGASARPASILTARAAVAAMAGAK